MGDMDGEEYRFSKGARVSLRDIPDPTFYDGMAVYGNEGWITKRRHDRYGLPEVFIHWDTNHWAWNGVQDRWTYEDHFDKVKESMTEESKEEQFRRALAQLGDVIAAIGQSDTEDTEEERIDAKADVLKERLLEAQASRPREVTDKRTQAIDRIRLELDDCDSFLVIAARRDEGDAPDGLLSPLVMGFFNYKQDADLLVAAQASAFGARAHQEAVIHLLTEMAGHDDGD